MTVGQNPGGHRPFAPCRWPGFDLWFACRVAVPAGRGWRVSCIMGPQKKTSRNSRGGAKRLPRSGGWN